MSNRNEMTTDEIKAAVVEVGYEVAAKAIVWTNECIKIRGDLERMDNKKHTDLIRASKPKKKKRKWLKAALVALMILFLFAGGFVAYAVVIANKSLEKTHVAINETELRSDTEQSKDMIDREEPISVLLMGTDTKSNEEQGRADVLMLFTINPHTGDSKMVSIPRDTQVELVGHESTSTTKINSAYTYGGEEMTVRTVEQFLNVPIDFFVQTNFTGFAKLIDAFGGVTVTNAFEFEADGFTFAEGPITLNGQEALSYCRMRKQDPEGDFGRQKRQRQVLAAIKDKAKSPEVLLQFQDVLEVVGDDVRTNLTVDQMIGLQRNYINCLDNIEVLDLNPVGATINGASMQVIAQEDRDRVSGIMRAHLELDETNSTNAPGVDGTTDDSSNIDDPSSTDDSRSVAEEPVSTDEDSIATE